MQVTGAACRWHHHPMRPRTRIVTPVAPADVAERHGLAYSLWLPEQKEAAGGVVILHGAGSCKESHHDFARAAVALNLAAVAFDQRGHGESVGALDDRVLADVADIAALLRERSGQADLPIALRGSSMGGYLAILAAAPIHARAVVAICPASAEALRRGLASGAFELEADHERLDRFFAAHELEPAVDALEAPLLLLHAEGDERVPVEHSHELAEHMRIPASRLITVPGGHHRSIQHDPEMRAVSLRWIERALRSGDQ
ncbi:MAG TPA: alpha/beta fold hydrolase [Solirubrobacteraceae bacterium]|nr:alpha/beta fold hydrolase [Solirubrobacteraceae bacterium]